MSSPQVMPSPVAEALATGVQLAYVTNDMKRAQDLFAQRFGITLWDTIEPTLELQGSEEPSTCHLTASFAPVGNRVFELIEPKSGAHEMFTGPLAQSDGHVIRFHHVGAMGVDAKFAESLVDDASRRGLAVNRFVLAGMDGEAIFVDLRADLGHWLEAVRIGPQ